MICRAKSLAVFFVLCFIMRASAADETIWRIGTFNRSSGEFKSQNIDYADPKQDPVYRVGQSKAIEDWQRFHPGPANGMTAGREHPFTISFDLPSAPKGAYALKLGVLYETPRLSHLRITVNGHAGLFYFHPKLDYAAGDWEGTFVPQTSYDEKTVAIPTEFLKEGENRIVLTALDDPVTVENSLGAIAPGHTGIVYDALELLRLKSAPAAETALIVPTIFYRGAQNDLREIVEVFTTGKGAGSVDLQLAVNGKKFGQAILSKEEFGERRFEFEVPQWSGATKATATVTAGGRSRTVTAHITPAKKWTLLIVPHEHLDVGFTDYPARVAELHSQSVDGAMNAMKRIPDFRWTLDGHWVAQQYISGRSNSNQERFLEHVRAGKVLIPAEVSNQHTGNASLEGLARALYGSDQFAKRHKLAKLDTALTVDVPSYTWSWASILHNAGIKYFVAASNSWRAPIMLHGRWNEKSPFYWEGPDGGRVMMWYSRAYLQLHTLFGSPWRMGSVRDALPVFLQAYTRTDYIANTAIIFGSQLENTAFAREQSEIAGEWNRQYAWPRLEFATAKEAMSRLDREFGGKLPVVRGDLGPYWEDGYGSDAAGTMKHRANQYRLATAEKMSTIPSLLDPGVNPDRDMLNDAWQNQLVYDEHTWTYVGATSQPEHEQSQRQIELKRARSIEGERQIGETIQRSWGQWTPFIAPKDPSLMVFNPLNWTRNGIVEFDLPDGTEIVDSVSQQPVAYEALWTGRGFQLPGFGPGYRRIRFEAKDVPSVGYKLYALKPAKSATPASSSPETKSAGVVENSFYRVTFDPSTAAIKSIFDKQLGNDIVDQASPYTFGSYVYVTGGDDYPNNSLYRFGAGLKPPTLTAHPAEKGKLVSIKKVPFGTVVTLEATAVNTPSLRTEVTLYDSQKKIEFRYELKKEKVLERESVYFAFPFSASKPRFSYATQNAFVDPSKDELPGGSREWYIASPWAALRSEEFSASVIPLDAPLVTFGDIMRGNWPTDFNPSSGTIFSWVMNNYWGTNFQAWQGGTFTFRYVVTSTANLDPVALARAGQEALTPLESAQLPASLERSILPPTEASLLGIDNAAVVATTWKLAEDGQGSIVRLVETAGRQQDVTLSSEYVTIQKAWKCSLLEDNLEEVAVEPATQRSAVKLSVRPFEIVTLRLQTGNNSSAQAAAE